MSQNKRRIHGGDIFVIKFGREKVASAALTRYRDKIASKLQDKIQA